VKSSHSSWRNTKPRPSTDQKRETREAEFANVTAQSNDADRMGLHTTLLDVSDTRSLTLIKYAQVPTRQNWSDTGDKLIHWFSTLTTYVTRSHNTPHRIQQATGSTTNQSIILRLQVFFPHRCLFLYDSSVSRNGGEVE
jgi:hypothetical protein